MAERYVDAAFSDGVNTATFFLADQYVVYDYGSDRVRNGVHPSSLLLSIAPPVGLLYHRAGQSLSLD
jgi:hypothetical protein